MSGDLPRDGAQVWQAPGRRGVLQRIAEIAVVVIGPSEPATQKQDVIRRAFIASVIIAVLPIQQMRIPGWPGVVGGCAFALCYDVFLAWLVFKKQRYFPAQVIGLLCDALVLMGASLYVFREMGAANSSSDIWLVYMVYIVTGGFTLAPIGSLLYTGLWTSWYTLGTLLYFSSDSQYYVQLPIRIIFFVVIGLSALAMANELQKRRKRLEVQNRQTMGMLATLVEARDTDAGAHLHRIGHFSRALALHLGYSHTQAEEIADASMMHDVGKANVPDAVLKKPGPLTPEEWATMQLHTLWGDTLLGEHQDFETARWVARSHHEHWDGSGYPDGLQGEQIPLPARIVAVADVFDALISKRPYKEAWPPEAALRELQRMSGSHLDPELVDAFLELSETGMIDRITREIAGEEAPKPEPLRRAA